MRATEWKRAVKPLVPAGQTWAFQGGLCYLAPAGLVLSGVLGDNTRDSYLVRIIRFAVPLFVISIHSCTPVGVSTFGLTMSSVITRSPAVGLMIARSVPPSLHMPGGATVAHWPFAAFV